ncbi:MAG TPA: hypothetical protein VHL80_10345 [Polyangia bacterium]|nr:hypothetical protein [Polyangia bacterium]
MPDDPANPGTPLDCPSGPFAVRQGGFLDLSAPGARVEDITVQGVPGDPVTAAPFRKPDGTVVVRVSAPHGTMSGDFGDGRIFKITTKLGDNDPFDRFVHVIVSYITAAPKVSGDPQNPVGDDSNDGVLARPYASFQQAASVAGPGDTIRLRNYGDSVPGPGQDPKPLDKPLPNGITVSCDDDGRAVMMAMALPLQGDAFLEGLDLAGSRLVISTPGSHVTLRQVTVEQGITISTDASVPPGAKGTTLDMVDGTSNGTAVSTKIVSGVPLAMQIPLLVQADGAAVTITGNTSHIDMDDLTANIEAVRFEGERQSFQILMAARIQDNFPGAPVIHIKGSTNLFVDSFARFISPVTIEGSGSTATFNQVNFASAPLTFQGDELKILSNSLLSDTLVTFAGRLLTIYDTEITGQGIEQSAGDAVIGTTALTGAHYTFGGTGTLTIKSGTTFKDTPLKFQGHALSITDAAFDGQGIEQLSESTSTLQNVAITGYTDFGYHLGMGKLDIQAGSFARNVNVPPSAAGPWALLVDAPGDTDSSVESQGTLFDGSPPPAEVCMCVGPKSCTSVLSATTDVPVSICQ